MLSAVLPSCPSLCQSPTQLALLPPPLLYTGSEGRKAKLQTATQYHLVVSAPRGPQLPLLRLHQASSDLLPLPPLHPQPDREMAVFPASGKGNPLTSGHHLGAGLHLQSFVPPLRALCLGLHSSLPHLQGLFRGDPPFSPASIASPSHRHVLTNSTPSLFLCGRASAPTIRLNSFQTDICP